MKSIALSTFALSLALFAASGASQAADEKKPAAAGAAIKISRTVMAKAPAVPSTVSRTTDTASYDSATKALETWKSAGVKFGETGLAYRAKRDKECPAKEYTAADQTAAGCTAADALPACSAKVYERCYAASYAEWSEAQKKFFDAKTKLDTAVHAYMTQIGIKAPAR